jgi:hypothetical protein
MAWQVGLRCAEMASWQVGGADGGGAGEASFDTAGEGGGVV